MLNVSCKNSSIYNKLGRLENFKEAMFNFMCL